MEWLICVDSHGAMKWGFVWNWISNRVDSPQLPISSILQAVCRVYLLRRPHIAHY